MMRFLILAATILAGCAGPDCQSTCEQLYGNEAGQCNIVVPGVDQRELTRDCLAGCQRAMSNYGEVGEYNPQERISASELDDQESVWNILENEQQAALWMDCVAETSCDYINQGYCAPVKR